MPTSLPSGRIFSGSNRAYMLDVVLFEQARSCFHGLSELCSRTLWFVYEKIVFLTIEIEY